MEYAGQTLTKQKMDSTTETAHNFLYVTLVWIFNCYFDGKYSGYDILQRNTNTHSNTNDINIIYMNDD